MPAELRFSTQTLFGFLLVLTRISFALVFLPIPGVRAVNDLAKATFCLFTTIALFPCWPIVTTDSFGQLAGWILLEAGFGTAVGLGLAFLSEAFTLAAQILGLQAGYSYASTIDPLSQNDTTVLQTMLQLLVGLLFFATGLDRHILRVFARSLELWPPGHLHISTELLAAVQQLGSSMFSFAIQLAIPVVGLLLLVDLSLALLGRVNSQMQLLSLAFPAKMLGALVALAAIVSVFPAVFEKAAQQTILSISGVVR